MTNIIAAAIYESQQRDPNTKFVTVDDIRHAFEGLDFYDDAKRLLCHKIFLLPKNLLLQEKYYRELLPYDDFNTVKMNDTVEEMIWKLEIHGFMPHENQLTKLYYRPYNKEMVTYDLGIDIEMLDELLSDLVLELKNIREELESYIKHSDYHQLALISHRLKGVSANLRIPYIQEQFHILEKKQETQLLRETVIKLYSFVRYFEKEYIV